MIGLTYFRTNSNLFVRKRVKNSEKGRYFSQIGKFSTSSN